MLHKKDLIRMSSRALFGLIATVAFTATANAANLLINPSFEDPDTPAPEGPPEYAGATSWESFGGVFTIEDYVGALEAYDGNQVLKMFGLGGVYQEFDVTSTDIVTATAWVYNDSIDPMEGGQVAAVNIEWFDSPGNCTQAGPDCIVSFGSSINADTTLDEWMQIGVIGAEVPDGATIARMVLITGEFAGPGGGAPKFDAASFEVTAVPVPAAVWLFGSGLLGLVGVARRRKS